MNKFDWTLLFGAIATVSVLYNLWKSQKKETTSEATKTVNFKSDLSNISQKVNDIAIDTKEIRVENREMRDRVVRVEIITEEIDKRLKKVEENVS